MPTLILLNFLLGSDMETILDVKYSIHLESNFISELILERRLQLCCNEICLIKFCIFTMGTKFWYLGSIYREVYSLFYFTVN